jgi:hypothetical protein
MKVIMIALNNHPKILIEWKGFQIIKMKGWGDEWEGILILREINNSRLSDFKQAFKLKALRRFHFLLRLQHRN